MYIMDRVRNFGMTDLRTLDHMQQEKKMGTVFTNGLIKLLTTEAGSIIK